MATAFSQTEPVWEITTDGYLDFTVQLMTLTRFLLSVDVIAAIQLQTKYFTNFPGNL
jgi:hypothetical protein